MNKQSRKLNKAIARGVWSIGDILDRDKNLAEEDYDDLDDTLQLYRETLKISRNMTFGQS